MRMTRDTEVLVAEMGMNHFGELSRMTASAQPDYAVITNIGTSHIEFLGSREGICRAKLEILEGLQEGGAAVLCGDEPILWDKRESLGCTVYTYGMENSGVRPRRAPASGRQLYRHKQRSAVGDAAGRRQLHRKAVHPGRAQCTERSRGGVRRPVDGRDGREHPNGSRVLHRERHAPEHL